SQRTGKTPSSSFYDRTSAQRSPPPLAGWLNPFLFLGGVGPFFRRLILGLLAIGRRDQRWGARRVGLRPSCQGEDTDAKVLVGDRAVLRRQVDHVRPPVRRHGLAQAEAAQILTDLVARQGETAKGISALRISLHLGLALVGEAVV